MVSADKTPLIPRGGPASDATSDASPAARSAAAPAPSHLAPPLGATRTRSSWISRNVRKLKTKLPAVSKVSLGEIARETVEFLRDPVNLALLVWMVLSLPDCVTIVLLKLGYLDSLVPSAEDREKMDEASTQVVNALFFLTCLIVFPLLCRHTFLLCRWGPKDKLELREAFCKRGKRKPHDWTHIAIVVFWGQVTCWTTFAFAAIYWLWPYGSKRPAGLLSATFALSMAAPVLSFFHLLLSPLSQDYDVVHDGDEAVLRMFRRSNTFFRSHREVTEAEWDGGVVPGCCDDRKTACLVCLFPCCMFGYNMERLGFGHRVVHTIVFLIVLFGPVTVFMISAVSLKHMGLTGLVAYRCGLVLTLLGVAYGGAWRIRMRETYGLPGTKCCGSRRLTDVCLWCFCSYCALCQEIRTADQYDVEQHEHHFYAGSMSREQSHISVPAEEGDEEHADYVTGPDYSEAPGEQQAFLR